MAQLNDVIAAAARGNLQAQRKLANDALECADSHDAFWLMIEGLAFARLAASQGDINDWVRLSQILHRIAYASVAMGSGAGSPWHVSEYIAWMDALADQGVPEADQRLTEISALVGPAIMRLAKDHRELLQSCSEAIQNAETI